MPWYRFLLSLSQLTSGSEVSLGDLQKGPPSLTIDEINAIIDKAAAAVDPSNESAIEQIAELRKQVEGLELQVRPELGTMSQLQQDNVPWLKFDTTPEGVPANIGTVAWDGGTTLGIQMTANVLQPVGEAQYFYIKADSTITKGQLIMFTGAVGASGVIKGAPATGLTDGQYLMGIAAEDIATNGFGLVTSFGHVRGWNTTGAPVGETWVDGDILYYNPSIAGGLTKTQPTAPNVKATIAVVVNAAPAGSGDVFVRVSTGSVLGGTDSNVQFGTLANGDLIQYDSALQYWKNVPASTLPVGTATNIAGGAAGSVPYQTAPGTTTFRAIGTAGQVFRVNSGATAPEWVSPAALTKVDDTNVTLTLGGNPTSALLAAASLTLGWTGQLAATRGGTGFASYAVGDLLYANTTTTLAKLPDVATGNALISGGVGVAPSWGKIGLTTHVSGVLPVANGGTNASTASITSFNNITGYTASGATGTTSTNLVFSTSPTLTTPRATTTIGVGNATPAASGAGISFPATVSLSTDPNTLDDYEEGTWTPTLTNVTVGNGIISDTYYIKIGQVVHIGFNFVFGSTTTVAAGVVDISGLPFAVAGNGSGAAWLFDATAGGYTLPAVLPTSTSAFFRIGRGSTVGTDQLTNTLPFTWAVNDRINFAGTYRTTA